MAASRSLISAILVALVGVLYGPSVHRTLKVLGAFRQPVPTIVAQENFKIIDDTIHCEDLHLHGPSNLLFAACEDSETIRFSWFPGLANLDDPTAVTQSRGSIHVIDPKTFKSRRLTFQNFNEPFVTHGIDVISDPEKRDAVYIFAINHLPNPDYLQSVLDKKPWDGSRTGAMKARSQIEVFHHVLGSSTAKHIRSVYHPLVKTPNDVFAYSPTSLFATNDHYYAEGLMRQVEDVYRGAKWSSTIHLHISELSSSNPDASAGVNATVAISTLHNNNGIGHGRTEDEVLVDACADGIMHIGRLTGDKEAPKVQLLDSIQVDSVADNPAYYSDPFATPGKDDSGFVLPGLSRGIDLAKTAKDPAGIDPVMVWLARPKGKGAAGASSGWENTLLFEDDGSRIRSVSSAILVGIDPKTEAGKKRAWLFVTGFASHSIIAVKVDL